MASHQADESARSGEPSLEPSQAPRHRKRRRVTTEAVPGTDPAPQSEPPRHAEGENDDRLRQDKPPHWG